MFQKEAEMPRPGEWLPHTSVALAHLVKTRWPVMPSPCSTKPFVAFYRHCDLCRQDTAYCRPLLEHTKAIHPATLRCRNIPGGPTDNINENIPVTVSAHVTKTVLAAFPNATEYAIPAWRVSMQRASQIGPAKHQHEYAQIGSLKSRHRLTNLRRQAHLR